MAYGVRALFDTLRSLAFGSITANYVAVGTAINFPVRNITITNLTDRTLVFSFDGTNDHVIYPASGAQTFDITANKVDKSGLFVSEQTTVYVKHDGVAPTSGAAYVSIMYAKGD